MKIKRFFKIILLICCLLVTSISIVLMYSVLIIQSSTFEYSMLIPLLMISMGVLSIIYHFKTLKYYSLSFIVKELKDSFLWIGNLLFAISIFLMDLFILYSIYELETELIPELFYIIIFCGIIFVIGLALIIEERWLYKKIINIKKHSRIANIDDIRGYQDDEL